jgi:para-aminobenzoate synthetase/4-amino-4-deoxychorismate lyase
VKALRLPLGLDLTPGDALRLLRNDRMPFALTGRWARGGAILGSEPVRVVHGPEALDALAIDETGASPGFVGGGWLGYLGFGLGEVIERVPPAPPRPVPLPRATLGFYDHVLRLDADGRWWFEALEEAAVGRRFEQLRRRLAAPVQPLSWRLEGMTFHGAGADGHRTAVTDCVERIGAGELFQASLCLRLDGRFGGSASRRRQRQQRGPEATGCSLARRPQPGQTCLSASCLARQ